MQRLEKDTLYAGRYLLVRQVGVGGFSEVWQAEDQEADGVTVAIKIYAPGKGLDDDGINLFRKEYAITLPINHPHLLKIQYFGVFEGSPYLIMPYCPNGSVGALLNQGKVFSEAELAVLLRQIGGALAYLHSRKPAIIHQDIKPDNVLMDEEGDYLLTDFGISSRMRHTMAKSTGKSTNSLSIAYAPPERFSGTPRSLESSDIFSLGVMLYELCLGDVPWMGNGGAALLKGAQIPNLPPQYSKRLNELIKSCLAIEPEKRPTAAALTSLATKYEREGYWDAVQSGVPKRDGKRVNKKWIVAAAALLLAVISIGVFMRLSSSADKIKTPEVAAVKPDSVAAKPIPPEEQTTQYREYLAKGDSYFGQRDYAKALMQFFIAEGLALTPKQITEIKDRVAKCQRLAAVRGTPATQIRQLKEKASAVAKNILSPGQPSGEIAVNGNTAARKDSAAVPEAVVRNAASSERTALSGQALKWLQQGEELFLKNNFTQALPWFVKAADANNAEAQFYAGLSYATGKGTAVDARKARAYFEKALAGGYELANYPLSVMNRTGQGGAVNATEADQYLGKAFSVLPQQAKGGNAVAQTYFAEVLELGWRGGKDEKAAVEWYQKAADQGYGPAQFALGKMYNEGRGVEADPAVANQWLRKAVENNISEGKYLLGYNLVLNRGEKDLKKGAGLIADAARSGHAEAQYYHGILLAFGVGVPQNPVEAKNWLQRAKAKGISRAQAVIDLIDGDFKKTIKAINKETGDEMEIEVDYKNPLTPLDLQRNGEGGRLYFNIQYKLKSGYPYCQIKPEGRGFEYSGMYSPMREKVGKATPYIARETEGILNDKITVIMYYEEKNKKNSREQKRILTQAEVPVVAVWL